MIRKRKQFGFTLVEMMIYSVIFMSFLAVLMSLFSGLIEIQLSSQSQSAIVQDGRYIFSRLSYDMGRATSIAIPDSLGDVDTQLQLLIEGDSNTYSLQSGNLVVTNSEGSYRLNSEGTSVSSLTFQRLGNLDSKQSIRLGFTLTSTTERPQGVESRSFQTTFALR